MFNNNNNNIILDRLRCDGISVFDIVIHLVIMWM